MATEQMQAGAAGVRLSGLQKSYGAVHAVDGVDLAVTPGQTVALLGPNGAGKSTTIDMLLGLTKPDAGTVQVFGRSPQAAVADGLIGAMLQTGGLVPFLTVRELLSSLACLYPDPLDVGDAIEQAGISSFADQRTDKLSGGQTQRARFGIALVSNPDLLVLDEPTVAMDVEVRKAFWTTMRRVAASGRTIVFATHYLEEADEYADRIVLMARGRIVADGATTEIKALVSGRTIRATFPEAPVAALLGLAGVRAVDTRGDTVVLNCSDSDAAIRELLTRYPHAHDIEIAGAGLEEAFLQLTAGTPAEEASL